MDKSFKAGMILAITLLISSCASVGPRQIMYNRNDYNAIIRDTESQQLLLNIVRLRYLEPVGFLKVTNIAGSTSVTSSLGWSSSWTPNLKDIAQNFGNSFNVGYSESPTVSYMPIESADFIKQLMSPISLQSAYLLSFGGVNDTIRLSRLIMQSIGDFDNASSSANARIDKLPNISQFNQLIEPITWLDRHDAYTYLGTMDNGNFKLIMHFKEKYRRSKAARKLKHMLHVPSQSVNITFSQTTNPNDKTEVLVQTRSILGAMLFLSHAVDVPQSEVKAGIVVQNKYPDGRSFSWEPLMHDLLKVHCSEDRPMSSSFVKVYYRGHWFFISDSDVSSKVTFTILSQLVSIASGQNTGQSYAPIFTIPVGGPIIR